ncbi:MAG TPA: hypothetical protein VFA55_07775 [Candidatus Kapabacteria bacterium]|nr:hypothetical protein [Candidatus Kapabacteria bacterium]
MRIIVFSLFCFYTAMASNIAFAQNPKESGGQLELVNANNALYVEAFSRDLGIVLNYEYRVSDQLSLRAGIGGLITTGIIQESSPIPYFDTTTGGIYYRAETRYVDGHMAQYSIPLSVNYWLNFASSHIMVGMGITVFNRDNLTILPFTSGSSDTWFTPDIGYRYQPNGGGIMFGIAFTPFFDYGQHVIPSVGASLGYTF